MACYKLVWKRSALKELRALPRQAVAALVDLAESLASDPRPPGCRKLTGSERTYRLRAGDYRLVYEVFDDRLVIQVVRAAHRSDAYR